MFYCPAGVPGLFLIHFHFDSRTGEARLMFRFLNSVFRASRYAASQRRALVLEALESRDLLSTLPVVHALPDAASPGAPALHAPLPHGPNGGKAGHCKILAFKAIEEGDGIWTFTGRVEGSGKGQKVQFGGLLSLKGRQATIAADETFSLTLRLQPGDGGTATAHTGNSNLARIRVHMTTD
jgi:hypothetical protein